jgi:hypothetical protein
VSTGFPHSTSRLASSVQDLASVIAELITPTPKSRREGVVLAHAPQYRLAFSLLNEDAAAGDGIAAWDVEKLLARKSYRSAVLRYVVDPASQATSIL